MSECKLKFVIFAVIVVVFFTKTNAKPTFDVVYKVAQVLENELLAETQRHQPNYYQPGYGPSSYGPQGYGPPRNGYYPPHQEPYPAPYPSRYPPPQRQLSQQRPYHNHGPVTYPLSTNYIQGPPNPYDDRYTSPSESSSYGVVRGSNSYAYGSKVGYKQKGY